MNYKELLTTAIKRAQELQKASAERDLTDDEVTEVSSLVPEIADLKGKVKAAEDGQALLKSLGDMGKTVTKTGEPATVNAPAKSLGEHFVKHAGDKLAAAKGTTGAVVTAPEYVKAATDPQVTGGNAGVFGPVLTEVDPTIVQAVRPPAVVADLLTAGSLSGTAITYFVEGALEGDFATVAEAGQKPQIHNANPTAVTDVLKKIAAWWNQADEMLDDLPFMVSEINNRGLYRLSKFEEAQILSGDGTGQNLLGLLNRSGIQTEAAADDTDNADALFRAMTKCEVGSGLPADGIVINPTDYQTLRLGRDGNGQYFGGGYFAGQYGNGDVPAQPPLWGLRTIVTSAIAQGTALVGAYKQAATVYRKGGVRVESTNSHASNFTTNMTTVRIEERVALAVRVPSALVKVTFSATDPA